jgi:hypothetical protein
MLLMQLQRAGKNKQTKGCRIGRKREKIVKTNSRCAGYYLPLSRGVFSMSKPCGLSHSKMKSVSAITWMHISKMNIHDKISNGSETSNNEVAAAVAACVKARGEGGGS